MKHRTSTSVSKANTNIILTNTFKSLYSGAKVQYTCTMKCYLTIKKSDIINFEGKWERLEKNLLLCYITQTQKYKHHMLSFSSESLSSKPSDVNTQPGATIETLSNSYQKDSGLTQKHLVLRYQHKSHHYCPSEHILQSGV